MRLSVVQDRQILHDGDLAIASYRGVVVCRAGFGDPARIPVGQDRLILTCFSIVQDRRILSRWRSGDRQLQGGRAGSPDPARISVGQDRLILTCSVPMAIRRSPSTEGVRGSFCR